MPANLTPDYLAAEREYRSAVSGAGKIVALEQMLATVPEHKGTEKLQADLKGASHAVPFYLVKREGAGQVAPVGPPNSGKSQLVRALTNAILK